MVKTIEIDLCDLEELKKENRNLKEVNKKLGEWVDKLTKDTFGVAEENKKLNEEIQRFKDNAMQDMREITELEIENRKLNEENKELRKWIKEHVDYQTQADFRKRFEHK